ncbi:MAG: hypothetical protein XU15_C0011G0119 [candidate division NC10 bacterium CSP1-5]|nr:MAG: hypothetical protein XU15_C0011G0119 [candidate division NC10 bacterium CSP1-5]
MRADERALSRWMKRFESLAEPSDMRVLKEARDGDLNVLTNYYMRLPGGGTRWRAEGGETGHYRSLFEYGQLHEMWVQAGRPEQEMKLEVEGFGLMRIETRWTELAEPDFLYPHGYLFLPWVIQNGLIDPSVAVVLAITGTGTSKTSAVAVAGLGCCALYPGFRFLNVAPTENQAVLMVEELTKWCTDTPFTKFVEMTRGGELFVSKPHPTVVIRSPFGPQYESRFVCQTIGRDGTAQNITGKNVDWLNVDEVQYLMGIVAALGTLMTRSRGQRANGEDMWSKLTMLTNPPEDGMLNPELEVLKGRIRTLAEKNDPLVKARYVEGIHRDANVYITDRQKAFHGALLSEAEQRRWLGGDTNSSSLNRLLPEVLFNRCHDEEMDKDLLAERIPSESRGEMGVIRYRVPPIARHSYIVVGDPGKSYPAQLSDQNVPTVLALDLTTFMVKPIPLVYFGMLDGDGTYDPWLSAFKQCMDDYAAMGYYDATNLGLTGFEDSGVFASYQTVPVTFAGNNKAWARSLFTLLAQDSHFAWPKLTALWYQGGVYREKGPGHDKLSDDVIASLFVYCLAVRYEGTLWSRVVDKFRINEDLKPMPASDDEEMVRLPRSSYRGARTQTRRDRR